MLCVMMVLKLTVSSHLRISLISSKWSQNRLEKHISREENKYNIIRAPQYQYTTERYWWAAAYIRVEVGLEG